MELSVLKVNPNNPQTFDDLSKLMNSIKEFPKMMELRPLIYDPKTMFVLGGNKRLISLQRLGFKEIPDTWAKPADKLTKKEKERFIVADNIGFGEWDFEMLEENYNLDTLAEWGLEFDVEEVDPDADIPENKETKQAFAMELDQESNYIVLKFDTDIDFIQAKTLFGLKTETARRQNGKSWSSGIGRVINGTEAIKKIQNES